MTSQPIREQVEDHLLTPKNSALIMRVSAKWQGRRI